MTGVQTCALPISAEKPTTEFHNDQKKNETECDHDPFAERFSDRIVDRRRCPEAPLQRRLHGNAEGDGNDNGKYCSGNFTDAFDKTAFYAEQYSDYDNGEEKDVYDPGSRRQK